MYCHLQFFTVFVYLGCKIKNPWETSVGAQVILPGMKNLGALQWKTSPLTASEEDHFGAPKQRRGASAIRLAAAVNFETPVFQVYPPHLQMPNAHQPACLVWRRTHELHLNQRSQPVRSNKLALQWWKLESATKTQRRLLSVKFSTGEFSGARVIYPCWDITGQTVWCEQRKWALWEVDFYCWWLNIYFGE